MVQPSGVLPLISMLPNRGWKNNIVWFLFAKWLLAFIIAIRYKVHDQDGCSMMKVYCYQRRFQCSICYLIICSNSRWGVTACSSTLWCLIQCYRSPGSQYIESHHWRHSKPQSHHWGESEKTLTLFKDTGHLCKLSKTSLITWCTCISTYRMHKITNLWKIELNWSSS